MTASVVKKLRAMLHLNEEQLRVHKKQTIFLTQLIAKTNPKGLHCLPLRLTTEYYTLNSSQHDFPNQEKLEDPQLYHYALFSDNILAAAVVVNSTITYAKDLLKHVFHIVTDKLNYAAMRMWFLVNPPGKASIQVWNIEEFTWLASYSPVLKQSGLHSMIDYYFKAHQANSYSNLKYRNPKYLFVLNHLRFYLPKIFPKLNKVLFLDDDIVVKKDLTALRSLDFRGNVNGTVETCGESFHCFDRYLNFSNPLISKNFDPHACGWAYGMNIFDLDQWKRQNITGVYHRWQKLLLELVEFKLREVISREPTLPVLVVGVPNVGKSALINLIHQIALSRFPVQEKMKRATVGPLPGVTQDIAGYKIAHQPRIYVLDTPGVLVPSIPVIETGLKLALAGSVKDSVVGKERIAQYLLAVLNTRGTPLRWKHLKNRGLEGIRYDSKEKHEFNLKDLQPNRRKPPNDFDMLYVGVI